jgi:hypothetical protein
MPSVPPAASEPAERERPYFRLTSCGSATLPIEAAVAMLEPLTEAKIAQPAMLVWMRPPGIGATSLARPL